MKKIVLFSIIAFGFLTLNVLPSAGQISSSDGLSRTNFTLNRKVALMQESETKEIKVNCKENLNVFDMVIEASIYKGNLKIEIFNPKGKKIDSFDIESSILKDTKSQTLTEWESNMVTGQIHKSFENPLPGNWIVKIIPDEVFGDVNISSSSNYITQ